MADDKPILTDEERERLLAEDALRRNKRTRYYGKLTQTSSQYEKAGIVRGKTFGQIVSERMLRGEGGGSSLSGAVGEKIGAVGMGIREKFDPIRLLNKVPVLGGALATMYGMKRGRSAADISYFTGAGRFLRQQPIAGELGDVPGQGGTGLASKVKSTLKIEGTSGTPQKNINNIKTSLGALKKLYALERMWYDYDKKMRDDEKRQKEIEENFKEENDMERHRELIKSLTGKDSKIKSKEKIKKDESKGFFGGLLDLFQTFLGVKLLDGLFSVMGRGLSSLLGGTLGLLARAFAPLLSVLGPMVAVIAGIVAVTKGLDWLISKFTGKNADYFKMKLDEETTPGDVKKIIKDENRFRNAQSEKQYETNKKIVETGKGAFGMKLGEKEIERAKKGVEDYEKLKTFKESDDPLMSYKRDIKEGKISGMTSYDEYKQGDKSLPRNLRNNNPGNIRYGDFAKSKGATSADSGGFAIFPTMEQGEQAQKDLLFKSKSYKDLTIDQAVSRYAPPTENNTGAYQNMVKKALGSSYDPNKKLSDYSEDDQQKIITTMQKMEGGTVQDYKLAQQQKASPIPQADSLSNRMNVAVSENKNLTSQASAMPPIMVNTTNNVMGGKGGGQSVAMGPTPVRNDEPMLLRAQYGIVKPV